MKLTIACPYCRAPVALKLADVVSTRRDADLGRASCAKCGSTFKLEIKTKRVRKGVKLREAEERAEARYALAKLAACVVNKAIGDALLAQENCTCSKFIPQFARATIDDGGHPLSTGWSRGTEHDGMMPTIPHHYYTCPCRGTAEEQQIIEQQIANTSQPKAAP